MPRILLVGYDPDTVDFSDPALPTGMNADKIRSGVAFALKQMTERGWEAENLYVRPDETATPTLQRQLVAVEYDVIVIGAGIRLPPQRVAQFELILNTIHTAAPRAAIAFNTRPEDTADAAARWLPRG
jgi:hypothetical protein